MKINCLNIIVVIITLESYLICSYDFNDYFESGKNKKILFSENKYYKLILEPFANGRKITTKKPFVFNKNPINRRPFQRLSNKQNDQYVWDEYGKFWTYKKRIEEYPDYYNNDQQNFLNYPCKPPFCYTRRCNQLKCSQSDCVMTPRICPRTNTDCSFGQKKVIFGNEIVCLNKLPEEDCSTDCGENGICVKGKCYCENGYHGDKCLTMYVSLCKIKLNLNCIYGCRFDRRVNSFQCICGDKEPQSGCIELRSCSSECKNGGICFMGKCQCAQGFGGDQCQNEIDSCSSGQMGNKTCQQICKSDGKETFQCKCRSGYQLKEDGRSCSKMLCSYVGTLEMNGDLCVCKPGWKGILCNEDVNECTEFQLCQHNCLNSLGSYKCICRDGFVLTLTGGCVKICKNNCSGNGDCLNGFCHCFSGWYGNYCSVDINECKYNHGCLHKCVNTPGSYICQCFPNHILHTDKKQCIPIGCLEGCENGGWCENNNCMCPVGFVGKNCQAVDICTESSFCNHDCVYLGDKFSCFCKKGYQLTSDKKSCIKEICPNCKRGQCIENKCVCSVGFHGPSCEQDINECLNNICQHYCNNTIGSYICSCRNGYKLSNDNRSCVRAPNNGCGKCIHGSCQGDRSCNCNKGYEGKTCEQDVNECSRNICQHICINTIGSYNCTCNPGYLLANDKHSCAITCYNGKLDYNGKCRCKTGWTGEKCEEDVDECILNIHKCQQNCLNTDGSYFCFCNPPFYLSTFDGQTCLEPGRDCQVKCRNGGKCVKGKCSCKPGYKGVSCEEDIDECSFSNKKQNCLIGECRNTFGSYECLCPSEYIVLDDQKTCKINTKDTMCNPNCLNGGVCRDKSRCYCPSGYEGKDCRFDVNECDRYKPCDINKGICYNTPGSYYCQCTENYVLMNDGTSCMTMAEAILKPHLRYRGRGTKGLTRVIEN